MVIIQPLPVPNYEQGFFTIKCNDIATMPKPENIAGQGFHTNPERINKKGRVKGKSLTTQLKEMGEMLAPKDIRNNDKVKEVLQQFGLKGTNNEIMLIQLYLQAVKKGNLKAIDSVFDRIEGKARQTIQHEGEVKIDIQDARNRLIEKLSGDE